MSSPRVEERFHAPRSRQWQGRSSAIVHLHVLEPLVRGPYHRQAGETLCSKRHGSNELPITAAPESAYRCRKCDYFSRRFAITWPSERAVKR